MGQGRSRIETPDERSSANVELEFDWEAEKLKLETAIAETEEVFRLIRQGFPVNFAVDTFKRTVMEPMYTFLDEIFTEARPPVIYLLARSGHGKSSLVNALANTDRARVGHVSPTTAHSEEYDLHFEGQSAVWKIVDSRGFFEATSPEGTTVQAVEQIREDLLQYKPDVIFHLIACTEVRNLENDIRLLKDVFKRIKSLQGEVPPVISVLTKTDLHHQHCRWTIEEHQEKREELEKLVQYMARDVLKAVSCVPLDPAAKYYGCKTGGRDANLYVIPVVSVAQDHITRWNIDRLSLLVGDELPRQAWMHFYKAQQHKTIMKGLTTQIIKKFAKISIPVGAIPGPASLLALAPLQLLLIKIIANLAGRQMSFDSVTDFVRASCGTWGFMSLATAGSLTALTVAEFLESVTLGFSAIVAGPVAAAATYSIGKTAEAFYFDGQIRRPQEFASEWNE